jgi:hypothetical protein
MRALATKLKQWWRGPAAPADSSDSFSLACACGARLTGARLENEQVIRCAKCAAERFVFPKSPLPALGPHTSAADRGSSSRWTLWLGPLLGGTAAVVGLLVVYWIWFAPSKESEHATAPPALSERLQTVQKYLKAGSFRRAGLEAAGITAQQGRHVDALPPAERAKARQLLREAELLGQLVDLPLESILERAIGVEEAEWQADFASRYARKTVLLDVLVQQTRSGYRVTYPLRAGLDEARIELGDLKLLAGLDLEQPRRLIFGAALASVRLETSEPVWIVRFHPESGVFLTDAEAAERCCPAWGDADTRALLQTQSQWVHSP